MKLSFKSAWAMLKQGFTDFIDLNVPKMAAALAYYTVFALAPMLIVVITIIQMAYGQEAIEGNLYPQISEFLGAEAGLQIQEMIKNAAVSSSSTVSTVISIIMLVILATGVFVEIQDSINTIWHLKAKPKGGLIKLIIDRMISFSLVISLGFIMLVSLVVNAGVEALMDRLEAKFPDITVYVTYSLNLIITFGIITLLFSTIFKVLPDAVIRWKNVFSGAMVTAVLFMLGKFGITVYLSTSDVGSTYGAAGSIIIILLWVYYSAIILYFGAILTRIYAQAQGYTIRPNKYAVFTRDIKVENKGNLDDQPDSAEIKQNVEEESKEKRIGF
jgi:membrane protein